MQEEGETDRQKKTNWERKRGTEKTGRVRDRERQRQMCRMRERQAGRKIDGHRRRYRTWRGRQIDT